MHPCLFVALLAATVRPDVHVNDRFSPPFEARWQVETGRWTPRPDQLVTDSPGDNMVWHSSSPELQTGAIETSATPVRRLPPGTRAGWAFTGLLLFQDTRNYWHLALVEGPDGQRYIELVENFNGVWQAQAQPATRLPLELRESGSWRYNTRYQLTIRLERPRITAVVRETATGKRVFLASYRLSDRIPAVGSGRPGLHSAQIETVFGPVSAQGSARRISPARGKPALLVAGRSGLSAQARSLVLALLSRSGLQVSVIKASQLPAALSRGRIGLLVLAWVDALPAQARPPLDAFLRTGGRLLVLGRPPFEKWSFVSKDGREWESTRQFLDAVRPRTILADFSREDMSRWQRSTDNPQNITTREIVSGPDENTRALQVAIQQLSGWDTLGRTFERPFPKGHSLTCFSAKGSRRTTGLIVEWREKDGSRWIANIPLATRWKHCALAPSDFPFWRDGSPPNRGGPGDRFNPENAEYLSFGVARSHLGVEGPSLEFSIAAVGTAPDPTAGLDTSPLHIEAMSPWHKIYQTSAASIRPWSNEGGTGYNPVPLTEGRGGTRRLAGFQPVHPAASIRPWPNVTLSPSFSVFCRAGVPPALIRQLADEGSPAASCRAGGPTPASSVILSPSPPVILSEAKNLIHPRTGPAKNPTSLAHPLSVFCSVPRARSATFDRRPPGRWIPFLEAIGTDARSRGACGWCYLPMSGPYRGAGWACITLPVSSSVILNEVKNLTLTQPPFCHSESAGRRMKNLTSTRPSGAFRTYIATAPSSVILSAAKNPIWKSTPPLRHYIATALDILLRDAFIVRAGSRHWSYFRGELVDFGAEVTNLSDQRRTFQLRWTVATGTRPLRRCSARVAVGPGEAALAQPAGSAGAARALDPGLYRATCELLSRGRLIDSLTHEFRVIATPSSKRFVTVRNGRFCLNGKEWHPHGVNYWPSYVAGMEAAQYWGHWLSPAFYDPQTVEKDLALLQRLGANAVSVQLNAPEQVRPLNDFLARAKSHGILANVFINGAHPLYPDEKLVASLIQQGRLADNDAIFAYDIAWEPNMGRRDQRRNWNRDWNRWILEQYGSLDKAIEQWGFRPEILDGLADNPADQQLMNDGLWRIYVAAYRRFADDFISRRYGRITRLIRKLDPNHLIGARTGYGGTGQPGVVPAFPFDLVSGARHLDFVSPEGWGLFGPWKDFREAGFTAAYGRWASSGKPVFWAEFGATIYPQISRRKIAEQARIYQHMYRMILDSDADGSAGWWFPGGLRIDENSDYGIANLDGTPRPAALSLQAFAPLIKKPRGPAPAATVGAHGSAPAPQPSHVIPSEARNLTSGRTPLSVILSEAKPALSEVEGNLTSARTPAESVILSAAKNLIHPRITCAKNPIEVLIDRDLHPSGYAGVWQRAKAAYLSARQAGRPVIIKTEATGKTTADMPLVTVGNIPYNGSGPLKYANAEFNFLRIKNASGQWQDVEDGAEVIVRAGEPIEVWASVANTGEAEWPQARRARVPVVSVPNTGEAQWPQAHGPEAERRGLVQLRQTTWEEATHDREIISFPRVHAPRYSDGELRFRTPIWEDSRPPYVCRFRMAVYCPVRPMPEPGQYTYADVEFGEKRTVRIIPVP
jgi:hypothetical protein